MREKNSLKWHGNPTLVYPLITSQLLVSGYSHSSWLFEVADTTLSGAVTMVTNKLQFIVTTCIHKYSISASASVLVQDL